MKNIKYLLNKFQEEYEKEEAEWESTRQMAKDFYEEDPAQYDDVIYHQEFNQGLKDTFEKMHEKNKLCREIGMSDKEIFDLETQINEIGFYNIPAKKSCLSWRQIAYYALDLSCEDDCEKYYAHLKDCKDCRLKVYEALHCPPWGSLVD